MKKDWKTLPEKVLLTVMEALELMSMLKSNLMRQSHGRM